MTEITAFERDGIRFNLDPRSEVAENRFTIIIGPNASGKSQLLKAVAEEVLDEHRAIRTEGDGCVLALSSLVTDSFPFAGYSVRDYRYLGLRQSSNSVTTGSLPDLTAQAVMICSLEDWRARAVVNACQVIGLTDLSMTILPVKRGGRGVEVFQRSLENEMKRHAHFEEFDASDLFARLSELRQALVLSSTRDVVEGHPVAQKLAQLAEMHRVDLHAMLRAAKRSGLFEIKISARVGSVEVADRQMSSGQLLLLSLVARVAAFVNRGSIVLIDEPEVALHPSWQAQIIPLLRRSFPKDLQCHIFLASHSPHIVADGSDVLVPGHSWGNFEQFGDPFFGRSPENILYRVFNARVTGNILVDEDLLTLTEAVSRQEMPSDLSEVEAALRRLLKISGPDTTALNEILAQAEEFLGGLTVEEF